jgi:hypothetical protein
MTQENQPSEADKLFQSMRTINPVRDDIGEDEAPEEGGGSSDTEQSLEERLEGGRKPSDLQIADKRLNPDLGVKHLNVQQMSRVFPDVYNPLFRIQVKDLIKNSGMSVAEAITYVNTSLSIAIDGEGRLDEIAIMKQGSVNTDEDKGKGIV